MLIVALGPHYVRHIFKLPKVKPARSLRFAVKLLLCLVALSLSLTLVAVQTPNSAASKTAQGVTAVAWLLSSVILILGYRRAKPQRWQLLLFWILEFASSVVVFAMHTALHTTTTVHIIRGVYMACCIGLGVLSLYPHDQEEYVDVLLSAYDETTPIKSTMKQPLFLNQMSSERKLSQNLMYGAGDSEYNSILKSWDDTLHHHDHSAPQKSHTTSNLQ